MLIAAQVALALTCALAYALRAWLLAREGRGVPVLAIACAAIGLATLILAVVTLWRPGGELLYWRTSERLLIGDLASLLLAIGLTEAVLEPLARTPLRHLSALRRPWIALSLWALCVLVSQWPSVLDAALRHGTLMAAQNVVLVLLSVNMWSALVGSAPCPRPLRHAGAKLAYLMCGRLLLVALACIAIWTPEVHYPHYLGGDTASSLSPLADQGIAGAIVLAEAALLTIGLLLWLRSQIGHADTRAPIAATASVEEPTQAGTAALAIDAQA